MERQDTGKENQIRNKNSERSFTHFETTETKLNWGNHDNCDLYNEKIRKLKKIIREKERVIADHENTITILEMEKESMKRKINKLKKKIKKEEITSSSSNIILIEEQEIATERQTSVQSNLETDRNDRRNLSLGENRNENLFEMDIDPDQMTYEELLALGDRIGYVSKGFTEQQIKFIPTIKFHLIKSDIKDEMCSICQYEYIQGERLRKLTCEHAFHKRCVDGWLLKEKVCPNCKKEVIINCSF